MWTITRRRFKKNRRGISNIIVIVLSLVIILAIVSNIVLWSYELNQLDWEKMKEAGSITSVAQISGSSWLTAQSEYALNTGTLVNGSYTDTMTVDDIFERFNEASVLPYNPSEYSIGGSTSWISGNIADLSSDDSIYMTFGSAASARTLYAHQETTTISGTPYRVQELNSADASGTTLTVSADTTGRKLVARFVYQLTGVSSIPTSTWTFYYRAIQSSPAINTHGDVNILVRKADGTIRTTIVTNVANSAAITTSWNTLSGTYTWATYPVEDQTDYLEIDYYIEVTKSSPDKTASLRIDDNTLAVADQTRAINVYLASEVTSEVEFTGSCGTEDWSQLTWTIDSALTTGSVNVTMQLYNFTLGAYPTSGDGYMNYLSSATADTDETKSQTITVNPTHFRNATSHWKMKIKGVKTTDTSFDFKADLIELSPENYRLDINGAFTIDTPTYPLADIQAVEIQLKFRSDDSEENWYLKAYNWTASTYSDNDFNSTAGHTPTTEWDYYAVNLTGAWQSYVHSNGTINIKLVDSGADSNQTSVDIDFLGVRVKMDGTQLTIKNDGSLTLHLVSLWITNSTEHQRYDINVFINSADTKNYLRTDISLPTGSYTVKVVTERGNTAVYSGN